MFGKKAERIKELERRITEFEKEAKTLHRRIWELESKVEYLGSENEDLKEELKIIKPVIETPGFKPAVSDRCDRCRYAYYSDYDGELLGCCKGVVCEDFESTKEEN